MRKQHAVSAAAISEVLGAIRNLDDYGVRIVSYVIASELNACKAERKKSFSLIK